MTAHLALRVALQHKLAQLRQQLSKIGHDLRQTPEPDSEERALSRENDEVLEQLEESDREEIRQLQSAIAQIDTGTYGICTSCGKRIATSRLAALPYTNTCIACAKE